MTAGRGAVLGGLTIAVVLIAVLLLSGGAAHSYRLRFENAGQLVKGDDVQVGGRRIGSITSIELTDDNQAEVKVAVDDFAPLHEGTTAVIRATSLSGIANRYIALTPGPNNAAKLDDGAVLGTEKTTAPVDLDQLFATFDPRTRKALDDVIHGSAQQYANDYGKLANKGLEYFNPALSTTSRLVNELVTDQSAFTNLVVSSSRVVTALAGRRDDLANLVTNAATAAGAIGAENRSLSQALGVLPGTLRKANTTFVNLRSTLDDLDKLVSAAKPATKDLAPFLAQLRPLVAAARPTIGDLRRLVRQPGAGNDVTDLLRQTPGLQTVAKPAFADGSQALRRATPVLSFIRPYTPEFVGWLRDFGQDAANYDANGHYARIEPMFSSTLLTQNANPVKTNGNTLGTITGQDRRCPGTAYQTPADGSAPYRNPDGKLDCDPSQVLPGS